MSINQGSVSEVAIFSVPNKKSKMATSAYKLHEPDDEMREEKYDDNLAPNLQKGDDPLIQQLPVELQKYVKRPQDHQGQLVFVERTPFYSCIHQSLAVLCCWWSICRCHLVKQGEIALTQYGDEPQILGPGRHAILSPLNHFWVQEILEIMSLIMDSLHIIRVEMGQLGYAVNMETGKPLLLSRGQHIINSLHFV